VKADVTSLLQFLNGKKQFIIPIYQRPYSWTRTQCEQLWNDIVRVATDNEVDSHFIGSIVHIQHGLLLMGGIAQSMVIDGQQRMTTIMLLLLALAQSSDDEAGVSRDEIYESYLVNKHGKADLRYKLLLTQSDRDLLIQLTDTPDLMQAVPQSHRLLENYLFFSECIQKSGIDPYTLYMGIHKLIIVEIALGREDNPQLIFESLNSTGMDLSQADLIRNYVLMRLHPNEQEHLYKNYWYPMEQLFHGGIDVQLFDRFMRDYLTIKQGTIPNIKEVYINFKAYHHSKPGLTIQELVKDIYRYARYFAHLALDYEPDVSIKRAMRRINTLKVDVAYPFLLEVYDDYVHKLLSRDDLLEILKLVEAYVFRRSICGIPTNALNKVFASLAREIDKEHYLPSLKAAFLAKTAGARFPRDDEFRAAFVVKDVYNYPRRNYLLSRLENFDHKEYAYVEDYTIEHIMPQNKQLLPEWQQELGPNWKEIQERYLHTIGNLTLTGYNSALSDRPFLEKRDYLKGGFAHSPLYLNESLAHLQHWNEETIKQRAAMLAERACHIWPVPEVAPEQLDFYPTKETVGSKGYSLSSYPQLQGDMLSLFEQLRKRILNLDASVHEEYRKLYIAYKTTSNFVDVEPQKKRLRLILNMPFDSVLDPLGLCRDISNVGHYGNGDVEVSLTTLHQLDDVMELVRQAYDWQQGDTVIS
jgi:uncharacterized protein with ParB-like and HNH nuclease domain/predicted transport protein